MEYTTYYCGLPYMRLCASCRGGSEGSHLGEMHSRKLNRFLDSLDTVLSIGYTPTSGLVLALMLVRGASFHTQTLPHEYPENLGKKCQNGRVHSSLWSFRSRF